MISAAAAGLAASLAGPLAFTMQTIATPHTGSMPSAGPTTSGSDFPGGGFGGGQMPPGANSANSSTGQSGNTSTGNFSGNNSTNSKQGGFGGADETPGSAIVKLLQKNASKYTWVAATVGSQSSAPYQLATGDPIMDIGGFTGSDPTPTLAQFKKYVKEGKIHYFIGSGRGFDRMGSNNSGNDNTNEGTNGGTSAPNLGNGPMGGGSNSEITTWVQNNFKSTTVDGVTVYDLTQSK
jgi:hypothetical protein